MTQATFNQDIYKPVAMPGPFGYDGSVELPKLVRDSGNPNFLDGFPVAYGSPKSDGGQYITRAEMNGIGNVASRYEFFRRVGGVVTFNSSLSSAIGGYPAGAVLDYLDGGNLHKVVSLIDNNTVDFTSVGVDNENWAYLNVDQGAIGSTAFSVSGIPNATATLGVFRASKTGILTLDSNIKQEFSSETYTVSYPGPIEGRSSEGWGVMIVDLGSGSTPSAFPSPTYNNTTQTTDWAGYTSIIGSLSVIYYKQSATNVAWTWKSAQPSSANLGVTKDHWYGLALWNYDGRELSVYDMTTGGASSSFTLLARPFTLSGYLRLYYAQ